MSAADQIRELLHQIASFLVWPVLLGLLGLTVIILVALGSFLREYWQRRSNATLAAMQKDQSALELIANRQDDDLDLRLEEYLQKAELQRWRVLGSLRLAVRLGPSLGLMGTLIPMADALQGLADGDLPALASNMVTAFAATVIGLLISVVAYLLAAAREAWVRQDSNELAFLAERILRKNKSIPLEKT